MSHQMNLTGEKVVAKFDIELDDIFGGKKSASLYTILFDVDDGEKKEALDVLYREMDTIDHFVYRFLCDPMMRLPSNACYVELPYILSQMENMVELLTGYRNRCILAYPTKKKEKQSDFITLAPEDNTTHLIGIDVESKDERMLMLAYRDRETNEADFVADYNETAGKIADAICAALHENYLNPEEKTSLNFKLQGLMPEGTVSFVLLPVNYFRLSYPSDIRLRKERNRGEPLTLEHLPLRRKRPAPIIVGFNIGIEDANHEVANQMHVFTLIRTANQHERYNVLARIKNDGAIALGERINKSISALHSMKVPVEEAAERIPAIINGFVRETGVEGTYQTVTAYSGTDEITLVTSDHQTEYRGREFFVLLESSDGYCHLLRICGCQHGNTELLTQKFRKYHAQTYIDYSKTGNDKAAKEMVDAFFGIGTTEDFTTGIPYPIRVQLYY